MAKKKNPTVDELFADDVKKPVDELKEKFDTVDATLAEPEGESLTQGGEFIKWREVTEGTIFVVKILGIFEFEYNDKPTQAYQVVTHEGEEKLLGTNYNINQAIDSLGGLEEIRNKVWLWIKYEGEKKMTSGKSVHTFKIKKHPGPKV